MSDDLLRLVNASGFAFQLAVEESVRLSRLRDEHAWAITSREHGWRDGHTVKFIDLVLTLDQVHLLVECKRMRSDEASGAGWVFLVPDPPKGRRAERRSWFRAQYVRDEGEGQPNGPYALVGPYNFQVQPRSWESPFCIVPGASDKEKPMLDRIAAELSRGADALLDQQLQALGYPDTREHFVLGNRGPWVTIPMIITTARLFVCRFDPATIPLTNGLLPKDVSEWEEVPYVRYRKSFDAPAATEAATLSELEKRTQLTIIVINATQLVSWLGEFDITASTSQALV